MANRYLKAAGGNFNGASTWSATGSDGVDTVAAPTSADEVYLVAGSGQLTITAAAACRRFDCTGYANTITHGAYALNIGDGTAPSSGVAMVLAGTYTPHASSAIEFRSTNSSTHTIDTGGKTISNLYFNNGSGSTYQFINNIIAVSVDIIQSTSIVDFNNLAVTIGGAFSSIGNVSRTLTFGSSVITISKSGAAFTYSGSNLTITPNTATLVYNANTITIACIDSTDFNGASFKFQGVAGTATFSNTCTIQDLIIDPTTTKTIAVSSGKTVTLNGTMYCRPKAGLVTFTGAAGSGFSKASGVVNLYQIINTSCTFGGGATWNACNNSTLTVVQGLTLVGGINYINPSGGDDALFVAYGMYKVAYTGATGTCPVVDEVATGATSGSTAKVSWVDPYEWAAGAGTIYVKSKSAAFQAEQVDLGTGGGHFDIAADFVNAAWLTMNLGATAARIAPKDINRIAKSPAPTVKASVALVSTTDATPIAVHAHAHGLATGDQTVIAGHATNVAANGTWVVTVSGVDDFTLNTSVGSGAGAGGATGTSTLKGIGAGVWTDQPATLPTTLTSCTASNSSGLILITKAAHGFSDGDCVYIEDMATALTANGCWVITYVNSSTFTLNGSTYAADGTGGKITLVNRAVVKLTTAQTTDVCKCQQLWTAAGSSTRTLDTTVYKDGDASLKLVKASPSNDTLYAFMATLSSLNLSGKQKLSFWIRNETAILANQWEVCLCSVNDGTGVQNTFKIPAIPSTGRWLPLTLSAEEGANLYNGVLSIAIYSGSAAATTTGIYFNNFIACTTSGLNLQSLISKNTLEQSSISDTGYANEGWYGIKNISEDGKVIFLDNDTNSLANANMVGRGMGYSGATNTYTTYIRETFKTALVASSSTAVQECMDNGTSGNNIEYQGGYSLINGNQEGESFFDGLSGMGYGLWISSKVYNTLNYLAFVRYGNGIYATQSGFINIQTISNLNNNTACGLNCVTSSNNFIITIINANNNNSNGVMLLSYFLAYICNTNNNGSYGAGFTSAVGGVVTSVNANNNGIYGLSFSQSFGCLINPTTIYYNGSYAILFSASSNNLIITGNSRYSTTAGVITGGFSSNYLKNFKIWESNEFGCSDSTAFSNGYIYSQNHDQISGDTWIFTYGGTINNRTATLSAGSGKEWLFTTSQIVRDVNYPIKLMLFPVYVNAGALVTVHVLFKKGHASNIGAKLVIEADAITGVTQQVTTVPDLDTEQDISVTCTPTNAGVIEVWAWVYYVAGHSTVIVDSPGATLVTQA